MDNSLDLNEPLDNDYLASVYASAMDSRRKEMADTPDDESDEDFYQRVGEAAQGNYGSGTQHDRKNKALLSMLDTNGPTISNSTTEMLNATIASAEGYGNELSAMYGIDPYLARLVILTQFIKELDGIKDWMTAQALAHTQPKINIAAALGVNPSTLSKQLEGLEKIVQAIYEANRRGQDVKIEIRGRAFTVHPDGNIAK